MITAFIEGWDLSDCRHHLPSLENVRLRRGKIKFGRKLSWDMAKSLQSSNAAVLLGTGGRTFANEHKKL